jgi:phosphate transport system permease protein
MALTIAVPLGVAVALFLTSTRRRGCEARRRPLVDLLAAVPSIVFGLWGLRVFGSAHRSCRTSCARRLGWFPHVQRDDRRVSFTDHLPGGILVLAIMILPIITALSREVFAQTPTTHKEGALALGATKWEMIRTAVLPFGKPGVISAAMLGLGRALGETVAVMILISSLAPGAPFFIRSSTAARPSPPRSPSAPVSSTPRRRPAPISRPAWCSSS